jgi:hypothetical protein
MRRHSDRLACDRGPHRAEASSLELDDVGQEVLATSTWRRALGRAGWPERHRACGATGRVSSTLPTSAMRLRLCFSPFESRVVRLLVLRAAAWAVSRPMIVLAPFEPLPTPTHYELVGEADRLLRFLADGRPVGEVVVSPL